MSTTFTLRGIEFNDERIAKLTMKCLDNMASLGLYPYKLESVKVRKQNKKFGCCRTTFNKNTNEIKRNRITINRQFIDDNADDNAILQVLYHEGLHSLKECFDCGHEGKWKEYAELVNNCYGTNIKATGTFKEYGLEKKDERKIYKCQCKKCGKVISAKYLRAPRWYMHPERFSHHCDDGGKGNIFAIGVDN